MPNKDIPRGKSHFERFSGQFSFENFFLDAIASKELLVIHH